MLSFMLYLGRNEPARRRDKIMRVAYAWAKVRHHGWGWFGEALLLARKADSTRTEFMLGLCTICVGLWWACIPQPVVNVFGHVDRLVPLHLSTVLALCMAWHGRSMVAGIARGCRRRRCNAARWVFTCWCFLWLNQMAINWTTLGTVIFAACMLSAVGLMERNCSPWRARRDCRS